MGEKSEERLSRIEGRLDKIEKQLGEALSLLRQSVMKLR